VWIAGNLTIRITKVLNADADKTGELEKTEGNPFNGTIEIFLFLVKQFDYGLWS
jgi:hypothetical protein